MAKLTTETIIGAKTLAVIAKKEGYFEFEGATYALTDQAFLDNNSNQDAAYFSYAVKVGDEIDEEGGAPIYKVEWEIINPEAEDGSDACDWDDVEDVNNVGVIDLETGRIY